MASLGPLVTLLTDFGNSDPYTAAMKGVILSICPQARLVDISHEIPPHDVLSAAFVLWQSALYFPQGTLHVVVVDPGVGTDRRILAAKIGGQLFLAPDNGVISLVAKELPMQAIAAVRNFDYLPADPHQRLSATFHGRDIFAPLAGQICNGLAIQKLGPQPNTFKTLDIPVPQWEKGELVGQVVYIDRFGNLVTNIPRRMVEQHWPCMDRLRVYCGGQEAGAFAGAYGFVRLGALLAMLNSMGLVEIAVNQGRAADVLECQIASQVRILEVLA